MSRAGALPAPATGDAVQRRRTAASMVVVALLIVLSCVGYEPLRLPGFPRMDGGDALRQISYLVIFSLVFWSQNLLGRPSRVAVIPAGFFVLFAWCILSLGWSLVPQTGLQRLGLTIILVATVHLAVDGAGHHRTVRTLQFAFAVILLGNFTAVAISPASAIHGAEVSDPKLIGNWNGMSLQKNLAGAICAATVLVFLLSPCRIRPVLRVAVILGALFFLYMTKSKTSMAVLVVAATAGLAYRAFAPERRTLMFPLIAVSGYAAWVVGDALLRDRIEAYFATPDALTGRAQIWPLLIEYAQAHPFTGAGFGSFWTYNAASPIYHLTDSWVEGVPNGHNGYLDILVEIGLPGLCLAVLCVFLAPIWLLLTRRGIRPADGALPLSLIVFAMLHNLSESTMLNRDTEVWVFVLFGGAMACRLAREARAAERANDIAPRAAPDAPQDGVPAPAG